MEKYIDTHAHYLARQFDRDRGEVLSRLFAAEVKGIVECGTNTRSNGHVLALVKKYPRIYGTIGYFPDDVIELENNEGNRLLFEDALHNEKIVGLGEIGFEYSRDRVPKPMQRKWFEWQLELAKKLDMPIIIHSREAEKDTVDVLQAFGPYKGVIHCFSYGVDAMEKLTALGYHFGIGGVFTHPRNAELREAITRMPMNRIVLETDAPYLSPQDVRRERNDSGNIKYVIEELCRLKGVTPEQLVKKTNENTLAVYPRLAKLDSLPASAV